MEKKNWKHYVDIGYFILNKACLLRMSKFKFWKTYIDKISKRKIYGEKYFKDTIQLEQWKDCN